MEIFRERATLSKEEAHSEEIRALKREVGKLRARLEDEVERERRKALQSAGEAESYKKELQELKKEKVEKRDKITSPRKGYNKEKRSPRRVPSANIKARDKLITSNSEQMDMKKDSEKVILNRPEEWLEVRRSTLRKEEAYKGGHRGTKSYIRLT